MKRKRNVLIEQGEVNVVPLMDVLTTMLFFLILMASSANFTALLGKSDEVGAESTDKKQRFDLVIALESNRKAKIYFGNFYQLKMVESASFKKHMKRYFKHQGPTGHQKVIYAKNHEQLLEKIQTQLIRIKQAFPHEQKISFAVGNNIEYQKMIASMDSLTAVPSDKSFRLENFIGQVRTARVLFPEISLQEIGDKNAI